MEKNSAQKKGKGRGKAVATEAVAVPDPIAASSSSSSALPPTESEVAAKMVAAPTGMFTTPIDDKQAEMLRKYFERLKVEEDWASREYYKVKQPEHIAMVTTVKFNVEFWKFTHQNKNWSEDLDATNDSLLRYVNELVTTSMELIRHIHWAALALAPQRRKDSDTHIAEEIRRVAQLMATPLGGMAQAYETRAAQANGHRPAEYGLEFMRIPAFLPREPAPEDFPTFTWPEFVEAYRLATMMSLVAGLVIHAINEHAKVYSAVLAKQDPPRKIEGYAKKTYESCVLNFSPFLTKGRVYYNPHGRDLCLRVDELFHKVLKEMSGKPDADVNEVVPRLAGVKPPAPEEDVKTETLKGAVSAIMAGLADPEPAVAAADASTQDE